MLCKSFIIEEEAHIFPLCVILSLNAVLIKTKHSVFAANEPELTWCLNTNRRHIR